MLEQRVQELELEKKMFETKHTNIEAALARWIHRACNDNTECNKLKEKITILKTEKEDLLRDVEQLRVDRDSSMSLFKLNQMNLDETKSILSETNIELEKLSTRNTTLEVENMELSDKLALLASRVFAEVDCQTEELDQVSAHTQTEQDSTVVIKQAGSLFIKKLTIQYTNKISFLNTRNI